MDIAQPPQDVLLSASTPAQASTIGGTTLLLIEPSGGPVGPMLAALARAQGQTPRRRVLGAAADGQGGRGSVVLEQVKSHLDALGPREVACLRTPQVEGLIRSEAVREVLASAGLVAVWAADLSQARLASWVVGASALARQHHAAAGVAVPWLVFQPFPPRAPGPEDPPRPPWLASVRLLPALPAAGSIRAAWLWQQVLLHWSAR